MFNSKKVTHSARTAAAAETPPTYMRPPTPFGGFVDGVPAETAPHLLVSGVSGSGKTRRVLAPAILMWNGPVVAVSSKPDLIQECLQMRLDRGGKGCTYVLDLSGEVPDDQLPEGVTRVVVDPTALVAGDDDALDLATILLQSGSAGAGGASGGGSGGDGTAEFFETLSTAPLAAILRAAGPDSMTWARSAVSRLQGESAEDESPSWVTAIERLKGVSPILSEELLSASVQDEKQVSNVMITMKAAVAPWLRSTVRGDGTTPPLTPKMLEVKGATLFIVAPATGVAAGAAVGAAAAITKRWRANQTERTKLPRLLLVVDELCNTMPWQELPTVVTESRAMGINLLCAVQATSQFELRYGSAGVTALRDTWPAVLCLVGAPEKEILEKAAWWYGQTEQQKTTVDHLGKQSQTSERVEAFQGSDFLPKTRNEGRLLRGRRPNLAEADHDGIHEKGLMVTLVYISAIPFTSKRVA